MIWIFLAWPTRYAVMNAYLYSETEPSPLVSDLDLYWVFRLKKFPGYRRLVGNWYLFLDTD